VQRLLEEAAAATQQRGQLETQLDAARAATAAARLEHETTKVPKSSITRPPVVAREAPVCAGRMLQLSVSLQRSRRLVAPRYTAQTTLFPIPLQRWLHAQNTRAC
jgi:hypothetical protein